MVFYASLWRYKLHLNNADVNDIEINAKLTSLQYQRAGMLCQFLEMDKICKSVSLISLSMS